MGIDLLPSQARDDDSSETSSTSGHTARRPRLPKRKCNTSDSTDISNEVLQSVNYHSKRPLVMEDRFDIFGKNVSMELRDLPNQKRLISAK